MEPINKQPSKRNFIGLLCYCFFYINIAQLAHAIHRAHEFSLGQKEGPSPFSVDVFWVCGLRAFDRLVDHTAQSIRLRPSALPSLSGGQKTLAQVCLLFCAAICRHTGFLRMGFLPPIWC